MSEWAGHNGAPPSPSQHSSGAGASSLQPQLSLLSTPGPHPLPAYLKQLGAHVAALAAREYGASSNAAPSALLASFVARALTLEAEEAALARGEGPEASEFPIEPAPSLPGGSATSFVIRLSAAQQDKLIQSTLQRLRQQDDPLLETLKMQVDFEAQYAAEIAAKRAENFALDQANSAQLARILEVGTNITSNAQVAALYRAIFKLMLANGCVEHGQAGAKAAGAAAAPASSSDRNIDREIAAALESVFPQAGLNAFNMLSSADKRAQVLALINIVLGIRLFNRDINKGGAGLADVPGLAAAEVDVLYEECESESAKLGDLCFTYADVLQLELNAPGSISASVIRLQQELTHRRQYILLLHQLQHEVLESLDVISEARRQLADQCTELRTLVGLRTAVPKEQVYPKFQALAQGWRLLTEERAMNAMRRRILRQLLAHRQPFVSSLLEEDVALLAKAKGDPALQAREAEKQRRAAAVDFDQFVETLQADAREEEKDGPGGAAALAAGASYRPVRLVQEHTPGFLSLPLEYQGYCPWSLVHRGGLLLPGLPALGIVRVLGRHYSFVSAEAMQDFCEEPEKYLEGVLAQARRSPALVHLLCLQPYLPHSDISELFAMDALLAERAAAGGGSGSSGGASGGPPKQSAGSQTPLHINTTVPDPSYHWNEWELRRAALQLAALTNMKTSSAQTNLSHFRRDNATQYTLPQRLADGTAEGKGTQTGVDKAVQSERVYRFHAGLRGKPDRPPAQGLPVDPTQPDGPGAKMHVVQLRVPTHVEDTTNRSLQLGPQESLKTRIVRDRQ